MAVRPLLHPSLGGGGWGGIKNHSTQQLDPIPPNPCWNASRQTSNRLALLRLPSASMRPGRPEEVGGVRRATEQTKLTQLSATCGRRLQTDGELLTVLLPSLPRGGLLADCNTVEHATLMMSSDRLKAKTAAAAAAVSGCTTASRPTAINTSIYRKALLLF